MKVSVVIPNWNGVGKIEKNFPAVLKVKGVSEVTVIDDASTDESVKLIKNNFPQIQLIENKENLGFAATVNTGVKKASGDLVFLLNNDAKPSEDSLEKVLDHFKDPKVFSVGLSTGGSWSWAKFEKGFFWHNQAGEVSEASHQTLWASGGSGVFRKDLWEALGGFDTLFAPFYEEDTDLGYRATKRGYLNLWEPQAQVEHYHEPGVISQYHSQDQISRVAQRNQLLFIWKNITSSQLINQHQRALLKMLTTSPKYWAVFLRAAVKLPEVLRKRELEKKEAVLTDEEILSKFSIE